MNNSDVIPTWSDTNQTVHLQKMARGLKFRIKKVEGLEGLYYSCSEKKALISFTVTAKLICVFVFAYEKCCFSSDAAPLFFVSSFAACTCICVNCIFVISCRVRVCVLFNVSKQITLIVMTVLHLNSIPCYGP